MFFSCFLSNSSHWWCVDMYQYNIDNVTHKVSSTATSNCANTILEDNVRTFGANDDSVALDSICPSTSSNRLEILVRMDQTAGIQQHLMDTDPARTGDLEASSQHHAFDYSCDVILFSGMQPVVKQCHSTDIHDFNKHNQLLWRVACRLESKTGIDASTC